MNTSRFLPRAAILLGAASMLVATPFLRAQQPAAEPVSPQPIPAAPVAAQQPDADPVASVDDPNAAAALTTKYSTLAGSEENARALVTGLRAGSEVTLTSSTGEKTTFTPAIAVMGHGNVTHALDLAREQLAQQGIANPTGEQLKAALNGGTLNSGTGAEAKTTEVPGVLALRAKGEGWGQIAQQLNVKLGQIDSSKPDKSSTAVQESATSDLQPTGRDRAKGRSDATSTEATTLPVTPARPEQSQRPESAPRAEKPAFPESSARPDTSPGKGKGKGPGSE